jgi:hypothetical protein
MKKLLLVLAVSMTGMFAHAEDMNMDMDANGDVVHAESAWVCGLKFKGTSKGVQVIVGKFSTVAYGTLSCKGIGGTYTRDVMVTMGGKCIGLTAGIGYFKIKGISSEISLFNADPNMLLGKYKTVNGEAAVIVGAGAFTAIKVGLPQLAFAVSVQLVGGFGAKVGIEKMMITEMNPDTPPQPN